jgi:sugar lactone lactonase YvrE
VVGHGLRTLANGLDHPEGVAWAPLEGVVYAGGEAGQLYRIGVDGGASEVAAQIGSGILLGLALDADGAVYVCDTESGCIQRVDRDGRIERYGEAIGAPNYAAFDAGGRLWVSDNGDWEKANGGIVCIDAGGRTERVADGFRFSNGLAVRHDWLYVVESARPGVIRIPLSGGSVEPVVELEHVVPDGIAFDVEEGLWIACWQPNRIYRLSPDGILETIVDDWTGEYVLTPTNVAFAGEQLDVLVLASLGGWAVKAIDPGVRGAPLHYPAVTSRS